MNTRAFDDDLTSHPSLLTFWSLKLLFDDGAIFFQLFSALILEAKPESGLSIRRPDPPPPLGKLNADAVHVDDIVALAEIFLGFLCDDKFLIVRAIDSDFRRRYTLGQIRKQSGQWLLRVRQYFQQAKGSINRVVVTEITFFEEHVTAHFAGQQGMGLFHFGLKQGMAGLPHDRHSAVFGDVVIEPLRAFDLGDDDCPWIALQNVPRE